MACRHRLGSLILSQRNRTRSCPTLMFQDCTSEAIPAVRHSTPLPGTPAKVAARHAESPGSHRQRELKSTGPLSIASLDPSWAARTQGVATCFTNKRHFQKPHHLKRPDTLITVMMKALFAMARLRTRALTKPAAPICHLERIGDYTGARQSNSTPMRTGRTCSGFKSLSPLCLIPIVAKPRDVRLVISARLGPLV